MIRFFCMTMVLMCGLMSPVHAQMEPSRTQSVELVMGQETFVLTPTQTQTQVNPGWNVAGIQTGSKCMRYLWGAVSRQFCETSRPTLIIEPLNATLADFILIKLKKKKQYRKLEKPLPINNHYVRVTPKDFIVELTQDERFRITPRLDLEPGEYFLLDATQKPVGELGDYIGWCFTIGN